MSVLDRQRNDDITAAIRVVVGENFTDDSGLVELGIDSLAIVRIVVSVFPESDREIELADLVDLRTVGQFRRWIEQQLAL